MVDFGVGVIFTFLIIMFCLWMAMLCVIHYDQVNHSRLERRIASLENMADNRAPRGVDGPVRMSSLLRSWDRIENNL